MPRARLELARLSAADFESAASTDSATGANGGRIIPESLLRFKRIRAGKGLGEGAGDDGGGAGLAVRRHPFELDQHGAGQAFVEFAAARHADGAQLDADLAGEVVADRIAVDEAVEVGEAAGGGGAAPK